MRLALMPLCECPVTVTSAAFPVPATRALVDLEPEPLDHGQVPRGFAVVGIPVVVDAPAMHGTQPAGVDRLRASVDGAASTWAGCGRYSLPSIGKYWCECLALSLLLVVGSA